MPPVLCARGQLTCRLGAPLSHGQVACLSGPGAVYHNFVTRRCVCNGLIARGGCCVTGTSLVQSLRLSSRQPLRYTYQGRPLPETGHSTLQTGALTWRSTGTPTRCKKNIVQENVVLLAPVCAHSSADSLGQSRPKLTLSCLGAGPHSWSRGFLQLRQLDTSCAYRT